MDAPGNRDLPSRQGLLLALQQIKARASSAASSAGNSSAARGIHRNHNMYHNSASNGVSNKVSTAAALEAALEASGVSSDDLDTLATTLHQIASNALDRQHLASPDKQHRTAWAAIGRTAMHPEKWLPTPSTTISTSDDRTIYRSTTSKIIAELRKWNGLNRPIPCKHVLRHDAPVTSLAYLPLAMLVASGAADGKVRLWDPCARRHKLAPPPVLRARHEIAADFDTNGFDHGLVKHLRSEFPPGSSPDEVNTRHLRIWPGEYLETPEQWTQTGRTFCCVAEFSVAESSPDPASGVPRQREQGVRAHVADDGGDGNIGGRRLAMKIATMDAIAIPGGGHLRSLVVCDADGARTARQMDKEEPWDLASAGTFGRYVATGNSKV